MERNNYLWIILALLLFGLIYFYVSSRKSDTGINNYTVEQELTDALVENATLSERVRCLEEMLNDCRSNDTNIINEVDESVVEKKKNTDSPVIKIITDKKEVVKKPKTTTITNKKPETVKKVQKTETKTEVAPSIVYGSGNNTNFFPAYFYEPGTEGVKFCVRLGNDERRHLPHLAISSGNINAEDNGIAGYNWVVQGPVSDLVGDWGITEDKTFFVSVELVEAFLIPEDNGVVELKAPATHWKAMEMTRFDDYYIYRVK